MARASPGLLVLARVSKVDSCVAVVGSCVCVVTVAFSFTFAILLPTSLNKGAVASIGTVWADSEQLICPSPHTRKEKEKKRKATYRQVPTKKEHLSLRSIRKKKPSIRRKRIKEKKDLKNPNKKEIKKN